MCALAHWLESAGIPTVLIGLVPQHVDRMRPPRALLVPFELGRPLGTPGDAAFQHRVLDAALQLAERSDAPVQTWFDEAAPENTDADQPWACPVSFAGADDSQTDSDDAAAVLQEIELLRPWHDRSIDQRGASATGASGLDIEDAVRLLNGFLQGNPSAPPDGLTAADAFKLAAEDLKLFYQEAAAAQPGGTSREVGDWFWDGTRAGTFIRRLADTLTESDDPAIKAYAGFTLVPEGRRRQASD